MNQILETLLITIRNLLIVYIVLTFCFMIVSIIRFPRLPYTFRLKEGLDDFFKRAMIFPFLAVTFVVIMLYYGLIKIPYFYGLRFISTLFLYLLRPLVKSKKWRIKRNGKKQNIII